MAERWLPLVGLVAFFTLIGLAFGGGVLVVILAVVVSIFLHELGHYLAARWTGMKATEFFIGFGPRIWSFRRGETEFGVKPIWAGAYVKILGMNNLEEVEPTDEPRAFRRRSYPRRALVAFAGPAMNLVLAFVLLFGVAAAWGYPEEPAWPRVDPVPGGAARAAGLMAGDRLVEVDGAPVPDTFDGFRALMAGRAEEVVDVVYERDGRQQQARLDLGSQFLGLSGTDWPVIHVNPASLAATEAHLGSEDRIVAVAGQPAPEDFEAFVAELGAAGGATVDLVVERDGTRYATALPVPAGSEPSGFVGIRQYVPEPRPAGLVAAAPTAVRQFGEVSWAAMYGLYRFFSPSGLSGFTDQVVSTPPGGAPADPPPALAPRPDTPTLPALPPADEAEAMADSERVHSILGIITLGSQLDGIGVLYLLAVLNVFLAVFNLIPLLPFDGGHIAVATYERGREALARRGLLGARLEGGRYLADFAKLIPVTYAVVVLIVMVGAGALWLDAVDPPTVPN